MDFSYTPEEEAFRKELRDWLSEAVKELPGWQRRRDVAGPEADSDESHEFSIWWHKGRSSKGGRYLIIRVERCSRLVSSRSCSFSNSRME